VWESKFLGQVAKGFPQGVRFRQLFTEQRFLFLQTRVATSGADPDRVDEVQEHAAAGVDFIKEFRP
jgi:hypothetical protein